MYAERLREIRSKLRLTIDEMAQRLEIKPRALGSYERKERTPSIELGTQLCNNLNINLNWFCTGEGTMFNEPPETNAQQTKQDKKELAELIKETLIEMILEKGGQELLNKLLK